MNSIESAVAENSDDVLRSEQGHDSIDNGIGVLLVKRRAATFRNRIYNCLGI